MPKTKKKSQDTRRKKKKEYMKRQRCDDNITMETENLNDGNITMETENLNDGNITMTTENLNDGNITMETENLNDDSITMETDYLNDGNVTMETENTTMETENVNDSNVTMKTLNESSFVSESIIKTDIVEEKLASNLQNYFKFQKKQTQTKKLKMLSESPDYFNISSRTEYWKNYKKKRRLEEDFRQTENLKTLLNKREKRSKRDYKDVEKRRDVSARREKRNIAGYKAEQNKRETPSKRQKRSEPEYRAGEKIRDVSARREKRSEPEYRAGEKIRDVSARREKRSEPEYRAGEKIRDVSARREKRSEPEYRAGEKIRDVSARREKRSEPEYRAGEKIRDVSARKEKRSEPEYRAGEKIRDVSARRKKRSEPEYRAGERERDKTAKKDKRAEHELMETQLLIRDFHKKIENGPTYSCECCHQLWFKHTVKNSINLKNINDIANACLTDEIDTWICTTCEKYIKKNRMPPCAISNSMVFPEKPDHLDLYPLEWRLLSPRIPFMKVYAAPRGKQKKIRGNVVNVPANVISTVNMLPRATDDTMTIAAQLKRQLKYNHAVMTENIRPYKITEAAEWLERNGKLFQKEGICFNRNWNDELSRDPTVDRDHTLDHSDDENLEMEAANDNNEDLCTTTVKSNPCDDEDLWSEEEGDDEVSKSKDTLLTSPNFIEDNEKEKVHCFAPGEGNIPMSIFMDKNSEELAFPNIFFGNARMPVEERTTKVFYSEICKSELRREDRRAANCIDNIFFKLKKLQMKTIIGNAQIALRKNKTEGKTLTAGDLRLPGTIENLVHLDEGYMMLKTLRGSPPYFKKAKSDLFAMIRQLGPATYFCSFSAAETRWKHLLRILGKVQDGRNYSDEEIENMDWETKCRLVASDPVTCTRQFDYQVGLLFKDVLKRDNSPIGKVTDFFYRVEFQHRGSPHIHTLLWVNDAPVYGESTIEDIVEFIDSKITCSKSTDNEDLKKLIAYQTHRHSHTCKRKNRKMCRFGFPKPPMMKTVILEPLESTLTEAEVLKQKSNYSKMKMIMDDMIEGEDISYEEFMNKIDLSHEQYILAIRSSIAHPTVFLKRSPLELRVNAYNAELLLCWQANLDIQYVLDVYACAMYIASYVAKSQRGISDILRKACQEVRNGNYGVREKLKVIGNKFLNNVEISAQEAVYIILQLPMRKASREVVFINTSPPNDRARLLKSKEILDEMEDEDEDIQSSNMIQRYQKRPKKLEKVSLAEYVAYYDKKKSYKPRSKTIDCDTLKESVDDHNSDHDETTDEKNEKTTKRNIPRVIRYVNFNVDKDAEKHYRELLMLYTCWRNEQIDLIGNDETFAERYQKCKEDIAALQKEYENNRYELDAAILAESEGQANEDAWDEQAPLTQQVDREDEDEENIEMDAVLKKKEHVKFDYDISTDLGVPKSNEDDEIKLYEMPEDEYRALMRSLNNEQMEFVYDTLHELKTTERQIFRFLSGGAGVGKSFVTTALYQSLLRYYKTKAGDDYQIIRQLLLAPTGKAAYNIKGNTFHSALKVPINQGLEYRPLDCSRLNTLRTSLGGLRVLFIDEISMVGNALLNFINKRLIDVMGCGLPFGGVNVIAVGDLFQLKPVCDGYVFQSLSKGYGPLASNLWLDHFKMYELTEIMRQKESKKFAEILNRFREGCYANNEEKEEDMNILKSRVIQKDAEDYPYDAQHLFLSNAKMQNFNERVFDKMNGQKYIIRAKDSVVGSEAQTVAKALLANVPEDPRKTMQLHTALQLVVGMKCEVCLNVRTEDGLTNGADGTVKFIELQNKRNAIGSVVWVEFRNEIIGKKTRSDLKKLYHKDAAASWTPIQPVSRQIRIGKFKSAELMRTQVPLRPSAAKTIHRSQGDTLDEVVVDFDGRKTPHVHYVGLSRVKTLDGLHIINFAESKIKVNDVVVDEMKSLRSDRKLEIERFDHLIDSADKFVVMYHNVRSLQKYIEDVKCHQVLTRASLIILSETRLKLKNNEQYQIADFTLLRNDAYTERNKSHHGMAMYVKTENIKSRDVKVESVNFNGIEISRANLTIQLENVSKNICVIGLYKPPKKSLADLTSAITNAKLNVNCDFTLILGDFNVQIESENFKKMNLHFIEMNQYITEPTTDAGTAIDLIYSDVCIEHILTGTIENYYSDHKIIYAMISSSIVKQHVYQKSTPGQKPDCEKPFTTLSDKTDRVFEPKPARAKTNVKKHKSIHKKLMTEKADNRDGMAITVIDNRVVCRGFGYSLTERDLNSVAGQNWLNDNVINFYLKIVERGEIALGTDVIVLDTFAYERMKMNMQNAVDMYSPRNLLRHDKIVIPIHTPSHWSLVVVFVRSKTIKYYDSLKHKDTGNQCVKKIRDMLVRMEDIPSNWKQIYSHETTIQSNGSDCGVLVCINAQRVLQGLCLRVTEQQISEYRQRIYNLIKNFQCDRPRPIQ